MTSLGVLWLARLLSLGPVRASIVGAVLAGEPGLASELLDLCEVESLCRPVGVHGDIAGRVRGRRFWRAAVLRGWLSSCDGHAEGDAEQWGIRGPHGLAAAYSVRWLGPCVSPAALDVPLLSAIVTAKRLGELASRYRRRTAESRAHAWRHGVGCRCPSPHDHASNGRR